MLLVSSRHKKADNSTTEGIAQLFVDGARWRFGTSSYEQIAVLSHDDTGLSSVRNYRNDSSAEELARESRHHLHVPVQS